MMNITNIRQTLSIYVCIYIFIYIYIYIKIWCKWTDIRQNTRWMYVKQNLTKITLLYTYISTALHHIYFKFLGAIRCTTVDAGGSINCIACVQLGFGQCAQYCTYVRVPLTPCCHIGKWWHCRLRKIMWRDGWKMYAVLICHKSLGSDPATYYFANAKIQLLHYCHMGKWWYCHIQQIL